MSPLDYVKKVRENLLKDFNYTGSLIKTCEKELDELVEKYAEQDRLLTEYDKFIEKNEEPHADSGSNPGVLSEPATKEL